MMDCFHKLPTDDFCERTEIGISLCSLFIGIFSARARGSQGGLNRIEWRCLLIGDRCWCEQWRSWGERLRSAATRRHTSGTRVILRTDYLEKTGCFIVKSQNKWPVFQCTVNWARARHTTTHNRPWRGGVKGKLNSEMHVWCAEKQSMFLTTDFSEPETFVGEGEEGLAVHEAADVFQQGFQVTFGNASRGGRDVGSDDYVIHLPERVIGGQGFDFEDVEGGAGDVFLLQNGSQVLQIDDGTAADVDQIRGGFHLAELFGAKQFFGLRGVGSGDDDEIADGQQVGQAVDVPDFIDDSGYLAGEWIDGVDGHPKGGSAVTDFRADGADTHDAERTVGEMQMAAIDFADLSGSGNEIWLASGSADGLPLCLILLADIAVQIASEAEDEAEDVVGDDIVKQSAHIGELAGMFDQFGEDIMFEAGGGGLDPLEIFGSGQQFGSQLTEEGVGIYDFS